MTVEIKEVTQFPDHEYKTQHLEVSFGEVNFICQNTKVDLLNELLRNLGYDVESLTFKREIIETPEKLKQ